MMGSLASPKQLQKLQRISIDAGYKDIHEFLAFKTPEILGYKRSLANLTENEAIKLIGNFN